MTANTTRKTKNRTLAISADPWASPPKPNNAAMAANTRKNNAHLRSDIDILLLDQRSSDWIAGTRHYQSLYGRSTDPINRPRVIPVQMECQPRSSLVIGLRVLKKRGWPTSLE